MIVIYQKDVKKECIFDVYYVLNMKNDILDLRQVLEKGYIIHMEDNSLILRDGRGRNAACVPMTSNRMFLHLTTKFENCFYRMKESEPWKWHLHFGYMYYNGLKLLSSSSMVHGLLMIEEPCNVCEACILGKQP